MIWLECEDGTLLSFDREPEPDKETLTELLRRYTSSTLRITPEILGASVESQWTFAEAARREMAAMLRDTQLALNRQQLVDGQASQLAFEAQAQVQWSWDIETEEFARSRRHAISGDDHATFERDRPASTAEEGLDADSDLSYDSTTHTIRPGQRRHRRPTWDGGGWW